MIVKLFCWECKYQFEKDLVVPLWEVACPKCGTYNLDFCISFKERKEINNVQKYNQLTVSELIKILQKISKENKNAYVWTNTNFIVTGAILDRPDEIKIILEEYF